ncbi:MAG: twin-arginine translocase TatA/TatE family subunit [Bacteroidales bacterium]|jgi:sec-independent protein translocase protein TatA|nr:twin-arginine translocase TatA/TatE family subunit [Bacteroidales bacterium]
MRTLLLFGSLGWGEILIIAFVILLIFGGKKIPELMKGLGKGVKSFKEGIKGVEDDLKEGLDDVDEDPVKKPLNKSDKKSGKSTENK